MRPAGIDFTHRNSPTTQKYLLETMGGGVALLDYNNDGLLDIFLVNGGKLTDPAEAARDFFAARSCLLESALPPESGRKLHRRDRGGRSVAEAERLRHGSRDRRLSTTTGTPICTSPTTAATFSTATTADGTSAIVTEQAGVAAGGWSVSAGFFDYDNDGRLDLFVTRYLDWDLGRNILCGTPFHAYCRPDKFEGMSNLLFHNEGDGRFRDVSQRSGIAAAMGKGMGVAFNDYDDDGFADIFVSNDGMEQFLFRNQGDGTFDERALEAGVALSDDGKPYAGMGVAFADYDNDGLPDIVVTNLALEKYALYRNDGTGTLLLREPRHRARRFDRAQFRLGRGAARFR